MLTASAESIRARCETIVTNLRAEGTPVGVVSSEASVGAGAFPTTTIPSFALAFDTDAASVETKLRHGDRPVIGRIADDRLLLDLRSVQPAHDAFLADAIKRSLG